MPSLPPSGSPTESPVLSPSLRPSGSPIGNPSDQPVIAPKTPTQQPFAPTAPGQQPPPPPTYAEYEVVPVSDDGQSIVAGNAPFVNFERHAFGSPINTLQVWWEPLTNVIKGMSFQHFDGSSFIIGSKQDFSPVSIEFEAGETLKGAVIMTDNGSGQRLGHISFNTSKGNRFSVGTARTERRFASGDSFLMGFFGMEDGEIYGAGLYIMKPLRTTTLLQVVYDPVDSVPPKPTVYNTLTLRNGLAVTITQMHTYSQEVQKEYEWSASKEFSLGIGMSVTAGVPEVQEKTGEWSLELSKEKSFTNSKFKSDTQEMSTEVPVPPCSEVRSDIFLYNEKKEIGYTGVLRYEFVVSASLVVAYVCMCDTSLTTSSFLHITRTEAFGIRL
jgi:hypothetical protein